MLKCPLPYIFVLSSYEPKDHSLLAEKKEKEKKERKKKKGVKPRGQKSTSKCF
jgi:hypothetical protein